MAVKLLTGILGIDKQRNNAMKDYYTLEYSPIQECFHYDQISDMVKTNIETCIKACEMRSDYVCLGIFKTRQDRQLVKDQLSELFRGR